MPLIAPLQRAAQEHFERVKQKQIEAARPREPAKPIFATRQELVRQSPQPDRLVAVIAAVSPLLEAAMPLLDALANMPVQMDAAQADRLHARLVGEVAAFQSVCQDARVRFEFTLGASYALCTALDEMASEASRGDAGTSEPAAETWMARALAVRFHGDAGGGSKVFLLIARVFAEPQHHIDLLELLYVVLRLGFTGVYGHTRGGRRAFDTLLYRLHAAVDACRRGGQDEQLVHFQHVEACIAARRFLAASSSLSSSRP